MTNSCYCVAKPALLLLTVNMATVAFVVVANAKRLFASTFVLSVEVLMLDGALTRAHDVEHVDFECEVLTC